MEECNNKAFCSTLHILSIKLEVLLLVAMAESSRNFIFPCATKEEVSPSNTERMQLTIMKWANWVSQFLCIRKIMLKGVAWILKNKIDFRKSDSVEYTKEAYLTGRGTMQSQLTKSFQYVLITALAVPDVTDSFPNHFIYISAKNNMLFTLNTHARFYLLMNLKASLKIYIL